MGNAEPTTPENQAASEGVRIGDAARRLGVSPEWMRQLCKANRVLFVETPYGRLIDAEDLERLVRERAEKAAE